MKIDEPDERSQRWVDRIRKHFQKFLLVVIQIYYVGRLCLRVGHNGAGRVLFVPVNTQTDSFVTLRVIGESI